MQKKKDLLINRRYIQLEQDLLAPFASLKKLSRKTVPPDLVCEKNTALAKKK